MYTTAGNVPRGWSPAFLTELQVSIPRVEWCRALLTASGTGDNLDLHPTVNSTIASEMPLRLRTICRSRSRAPEIVRRPFRLQIPQNATPHATQACQPETAFKVKGQTIGQFLHFVPRKSTVDVRHNLRPRRSPATNVNLSAVFSLEGRWEKEILFRLSSLVCSYLESSPTR